MKRATMTPERFHADLMAKIPQEWHLRSDQLGLMNNIDIVKTCGLLDPNELMILQHNATDLASLLASKQLTAVKVTTSFLKAAAVAHQAVNCVFDFFPDEALDRAKWLDEHLYTTGKVVGPLHGVPISIKDLIAIKGRSTTTGLLKYAGNNIAFEDCLLIKILRDAGAVFYCKTAVPQAAVHLETDSFAGTCINPYNRNLTSGGSSGGEGALIAMGGSVLGVGTDLAGSIRAPASACGIFGFKPTSSRVPKWGGNMDALGGADLVAGSTGPMARSVEDLELFFRTVLAAEPWTVDPTMTGLNWDSSRVVWKGGEKPKIGVMWDDGNVKPHLPMLRALKDAVDSLRCEGFDVVDFQPLKSVEAWELLAAMFFADGGDTLKQHCRDGGEDVLPLTNWLLDQTRGALNSTELLKLGAERDTFRPRFDSHFILSKVDVILTPASFGCARPHGTSKYPHYFSIFNLADYPAAIFPTGSFVDSGMDTRLERDEFLSQTDRDLHDEYDPMMLERAPISLQLVAGRWEDEKLMRALHLISSAVRQQGV